MTQTFKVGDTGPGGGIVFLTPQSKDNPSGKYFEVAPVTWYAPFGCTTRIGQVTILTVENDRIGDGAANVAFLRDTCVDWAKTASWVASTMSISGSSDWYLPSLDELRALYAVRDVVACVSLCATSFGKAKYWSSTTASDGGAYVVDFALDSGAVSSQDRTTGAFIRPVRSFS